MDDLFEIVMHPEKAEGDRKEVRLCIRLKIGNHETACPVSRECRSYGALDDAIKDIEGQLDALREKGKKIFSETSTLEGLDIDPDMDAEEIWSVLSKLSEEDQFLEVFNGLDEPKRREVAEHVLTKCDIFSGRASAFSSGYNSESGLLE